MRLGVNIDHIATVRQARLGARPDPLEAARACERAGADSVVCHLREDRRHIQDRDVERLVRRVSTRLNLEMSIAPGVVDAALRVQPWQVTLVPERRRELTTEGGLDVIRLERQLTGLVRRFHQRKISVSLFVDPVASQIKAAERTGATIVELHTGRYANAGSAQGRKRELASLAKAAALARRSGLAVAAGHGLDYDNVKPVAALDDLEELNIGFSIVARALFTGLERAVRDMKALIS